MKLILLSAVSAVIIFSSCAPQDDPKILQNPWLGQKPPGKTPEIFTPDFVSTELEEFGCSFTPDGREFYFTRVFPDTQKRTQKMTIMVTRIDEQGWTKPEPAPFGTEYDEGEPNFSPGGDMVLYGRLMTDKSGKHDPRVMISRRNINGWTEPHDLMHGMFASITRDSIIYYTDVSSGHVKGDLYRIRYSRNKDQQPKKLGEEINSEQQDAHPFVTPDGSMLLFDSNRPGGFGDNDLYICFRQDEGNWSNPVNMGKTVNTKEYDAIPYLSPDGKCLFFFRKGDIYWVDAGFLNELRSIQRKSSTSSD